MRRSFNGVGILTTPNNLFFGLSFGNDACAEHENGIKNMAKNLGLLHDTENYPGVDSRIITKPENVLLLKNETMIMLTTKRKMYHEQKDELSFENFLCHEFRNLTLDELGADYVCAWDEENFQMIGSLKHYEYLFETMKQNIDNKDVCIAGYSKPFSGTTFNLFICHRLNVEIKNGLYEADMKCNHLNELMIKHGFRKLLDDRKRSGYREHHYYYCACSPSLLCSDYKNEKTVKEAMDKAHTKYNLNFWVNYSDADGHYGWHTAEQIKEWLESDTKTLLSINKEFKKKYDTK